MRGVLGSRFKVQGSNLEPPFSLCQLENDNFSAKKTAKSLQIQNKAVPLHPQSRKIDAQMAESVDALVSNTSGFTSIPVRPRVWVQIKS